MADVTPQKRVLPARERRESAAKRRASSPGIQPTPAPKASPVQSSEPRPKRKYTKRGSIARNVEIVTRTSTSTPGVEEFLPTKVTASKPLPTLREKQAETLSKREYQSIADSAILSASLHRSRIQWLSEGVFKRYWVKPFKRKGVVEQPPDNPDVKSMQKLGNATITIEPHTFEATFYTVREAVPVAAQFYRHPNQHTAKPPQPLPPAIAQSGVRSSVPPTLVTPAVSQPSASTTTTLPVKQENESQVKKEPPAAPASLPPTPLPQAVPPPSGPPKPSDDPVIQMLAARAASDPRLKGLMKIVALSQANPEQLREFQSHIDEFNKIIKQRDAKGGETNSKSKPISTPTSAQHAASSSNAPRGPAAVTHTPSTSGAPSYATAPYAGFPPHPPPPRPEAIIKHIIIEFHSPVSSTQGATTDRYLFPENAVLEMRTGGMEMVVSFFTERKGEDILKCVGPSDDGEAVHGQKYKADQEYFQPVTMLIKATQHRTIETIARAARPLVEVQAHMKSVMEKKTRAPREYLVYQLPRDKALQTSSATDFVDSGVDVSDAEDDELKDYYGL